MTIHRTRRGRAALRVAMTAAAVLAASIAFADDASDRQSYINEIESNLNDASSRLSSVASSSDDGYIRYAQGHIDKVRDLVGRLNDKKGDDSKAREIVDRYPRYISDFGSATKELTTLKARQRTAAELDRQCKAFDTSMIERAKAAKDDPKGADELSDFAKSVGRKADEMMRDAERTKSEVERSRDEAKRFSASDGRWSYVRDALHRAADEMARNWLTDYEQARRDCEEVLKRERHREVERVLGQLANSRSGRAELRKKIDEMLALITNKITDVQSQSSSSEVNGAVEITKQVDSLLERLRNAQGDDPETKNIVSYWPSWSQELRTSLEALRDMKQRQHRADEGADKCKEAERVLQDSIRTWVGDPTKNKEGIAQLPGRARQLGNEWKPKLEAAATGDSEMANLHSTAKRFSRSDGPWNEINRRLHSSADRVLEHWKTKYAAAKSACTNLSLGEEHPDVKNALAEMQRSTSAAATSYRELRAEFRRWEGEVDKLRDWSNQDVEEIRQAFCRAPDAGDYDEVNAVANRWASKLNEQWGSITGQGDRIKARAQELVNKGRALKNGPKVISAVDTVLASIAKLKEHQLKGSNDPLLKAFADFGVQEHERRQSKCGSNREIPISGNYCSNPNPKRSDCKMDCVTVSSKTCTIIEIKPKGAEDLGWKQANAYFRAINDMFAQRGTSEFSSKLAVFRECVSDDGKTLSLVRTVETYDFCPSQAQVGVQVQETRVTIPEEEE